MSGGACKGTASTAMHSSCPGSVLELCMSESPALPSSMSGCVSAAVMVSPLGAAPGILVAATGGSSGRAPISTSCTLPALPWWAMVSTQKLWNLWLLLMQVV